METWYEMLCVHVWCVYEIFSCDMHRIERSIARLIRFDLIGCALCTKISALTVNDQFVDIIVLTGTENIRVLFIALDHRRPFYYTINQSHLYIPSTNQLSNHEQYVDLSAETTPGSKSTKNRDTVFHYWQ